MEKLKVGIAGYGIVGKRRAEYIKKHPSLKLTAICDETFDSEEFEPDGIKKYRSYKDLLCHKLDMVFICMPNNLAAEIAVKALKNGWHVFCEKPPGRTVEEIEAVLNQHALCPKQKIMYGFNHRHHDSVRDALDIVESGELGKIINIRGVYGKSRLITFEQTDWRTKREIAGGGVLLDQGIHMVDLMRLFAGDFVEIKSFISNNHWKYDVEDNAYAIMRTASGVVVMLNSSATQWRHRFNLDINLELGSLILGGIISGTKSYGDETLTIVKVDKNYQTGDPKEFITKYNHDPSWGREVDEFVNCIINDVPVTNGSPQEALKTMKLVYEIYCADNEWKKSFSISSPRLLNG